MENRIDLDMTPEQFKEALQSVLNENRTIDNEEHSEHHKTFRALLPAFNEWMEERKNRKKAWDKFKLSFIGGVAVALVGFLVFIGKFILELGHK